MGGPPARMQPKLLIFVVAYQAESTIARVLTRIPASLAREYDVEVLVIDDASADQTFGRSRRAATEGALPFPVRVLYNPVNQGYGGNQKIGYHYAITHGFDYVALLHGDGQYAPECLPDLLQPLRDGSADACFGSRMLTRGGARKGGMPLYKFIGNRVLSTFQNILLGTSMSEFHSGYRAYAVRALARVPFDLNTTQFHFDTEIIIQLLFAGCRIVERPIPTYYGDEICRVNGLKYARDVVRAVVRARAQGLGLFYDARFDVSDAARPNAHYEPKLDFDSPHRTALDAIRRGSRVVDLGCAGGQLAAAIRRNGNYVVGVDVAPLAPDVELDEFHQHDLNRGVPAPVEGVFDVVLLLDVIEHLGRPEAFARELRARFGSPRTRFVVSTGNVGFIITRLMLLLGQFNYGKRGILDLTHTRLFTFASLRRLFEQHGFRVVESRGIPGPFPLAIRNRTISRFLLALNAALIKVSKGLFSYQMVMMLEALPSLEVLLGDAEQASAREETVDAPSAVGRH
jgi:2-polyprenyl-3-methyl-5-hydroxy-6-metoxy-1,4-benzoquinol methylase